MRGVIMKLKHKDLLCIHDLSTEEVLLILDVQGQDSGHDVFQSIHPYPCFF